MKVQAKGIEAAQAAIDAAIKDVNIESEEMLVVMLQAIAANTKPYVPVDESALINSERRSTTMTPNGPEGKIGWGAEGAFSVVGKSGRLGTPVQEYAVYVHEGPQNRWQKSGASNKFLEKGVRDFIRDDLSRIIQAYTP